MKTQNFLKAPPVRLLDLFYSSWSASFFPPLYILLSILHAVHPVKQYAAARPTWPPCPVSSTKQCHTPIGTKFRAGLLREFMVVSSFKVDFRRSCDAPLSVYQYTSFRNANVRLGIKWHECNIHEKVLVCLWKLRDRGVLPELLITTVLNYRSLFFFSWFLIRKEKKPHEISSPTKQRAFPNFLALHCSLWCLYL